MNKWLKLFIIIGSCIVICGIGFVIYKAIDSSDGDVIDSSKALYKEDTIVDDFQFMSAKINKVSDSYYMFSAMVKNVSDKDYDIDSIEVDFYNNNIFLSSNDIENADILKRIEKINQLNNINFYYWDLSLSNEMAAVHIVCDNFNYTNIDMMSLKEYNDIYQEDTSDFLLALDLGDQISTLL